MKVTIESKVAAGFILLLLVIIGFVVNTVFDVENNVSHKTTIILFLVLVDVILAILAVIYYLFRKDMSMRRKAERELLVLNEEMESRIRSRTAQLEEGEKKLSKRVSELNSFMYKATHDLRSPMASVMGLVSIAEGELNDPAALRDYFSMIHKSMSNMERLLLDLVSITRVTQSEMGLSEVHFEKMIGAILYSLEHYPDYETIVVQKNISEPVAFYGDDKLLYSVLQNLIDNAIKYRKIDPLVQSEIYIDIETNERSATIRICDNGIGIPAKAQEKVFDMFYRATNVATGTGLGLYIVKSAIEKMNGRIELKGRVEGGTEIMIVLPNGVK